MNNKDLMIRDRLQKDKQISDKADKIFNNFKEEFKLEDNEGRKVIKISFNKFLAIAASVAIVGALGTILCVNKPWENKSKLDIQAEQKDEPKVPEIILDKEWEKDNIKLRYPSNWNLTNNESYAEPTVLAAPGDNEDVKAKLYITINENTGNRSAKEIIEGATRPDYGVPTKTISEGEKDIASVKAYYKTQSMSYDDGSNWNSTTIILIKDIFMYEFKFIGIEDEYNSYYPVFDKILDSVEFINLEKDKFVSLSIDTANKKIVDGDIDKYYIKKSDNSLAELSIREGKVYLTSRISKDKWVEYGIVKNNSDVKVNENFEAEITGFDKKVVDAKISCYGQTVNEVFIVFLMEDGTLEYSTIQNAIKNLTTEGKVNNVSNIQRIYNCSIGWKDGGGISSVIALDSENNMYDIGYILFRKDNVKTEKEEASDNFISLSIDTADKKIVDRDVDKYYIKESDNSLVELSIREGRVYLTNIMSEDKWVEFGIVENKSDVKVKENFEAEITGFNKKVVDAKVSCYGQTVNEVFVVFLMEDGTLEYSTIQNAIKDLTTEGKVNNVSHIQRIYNCSIGWKDGGGISSAIALDSENNMYDIGYILYKEGDIKQY